MLLTNWLRTLTSRCRTARSRRIRHPRSRNRNHYQPALSRRPIGIEELEDRTLLTSCFSIDDVSTAEGDSGSTEVIFTVSRSGSSAGDLNESASISFSTQDGTATSLDNDYQELTGVLDFSADAHAIEQTQTVTILVNSDSLSEGNETFHVLLSNNSNGTTISDAAGTATILNDDPNTISINDVTASENETFTFEISLSQVAGSDITFLVNTVTDTADNTDYTFLANKKVTLHVGELSTQVSIHVHDDDNQEEDELFSLVLSNLQIDDAPLPDNVSVTKDTGQGTIVNDDSLPGSFISISSEKIIEGDLNHRDLLKFYITRTGNTAGDLNFDTTVDFNTINGTAEAGEDYQSISNTVTFAASSTAITQTAYVNVYVYGDFQNENTETVIGRLSNPTGGSQFKGGTETLEATGVIMNDDTDFEFQESFSADPIYANHSGDQFGHSVAIDDDTLVVSAPGNSLDGYQSGVAYVYQRNIQGTLLDQTDDTWDFQTVLQSPVPKRDSWFAGSIAIYGNTIVISAQGDGSGAVYVFTRSGDDWITETPRVDTLQIQGLSSVSRFGTSVDIYENTIVVGARFDFTSGTRSGAAYIFEKVGNDWSSPSRRVLIPNNPDYNDFYGCSVAIHSDLIVVGASDEDDLGNSSGAAYVYSKVGDNWTNEQPEVTKLTASNGEAGDYFGTTVDTNGTEVMVLARLSNGDANQDDVGSIYLYSKTGPKWTSNSLSEFEISGTQENQFDSSVTLNGSQLLVATRNGDTLIFSRNGSEWNAESIAKTILSHEGKTSYYSQAGIAIFENTIVVGTPYLSTSGSSSGLVSTFEKDDDIWVQANEIVPDISATAHNGLDNLGQALAVTDNYLVIGAPATDSQLAPTGVVYIYSRNDAGTPNFDADDTWDYETTLYDPAPEANRDFGTSVLIEGTTIVVEATPTEFPFESEIYIFTRNGSDWKTIPPTVTPLLETVGRTLLSETSIAFQNNTIVVGNVRGIVNEPQSGAVYVYEKNGNDWSTILPTESVLVASDAERYDSFGVDVDIDGDQIIAGANDNQDRGAAYLFQKGTDGWSSATETKIIGADIQMNASFGKSVAIENNTVIASGSGVIYIFDGSAGWDDPVETKITPATDPRTYSFGKDIHFSDHLLVVNGNTSPSVSSISTGAVYIYDGSDGWDNLKETVLTNSTVSEIYHRGFGHSAVAIHQNQLFISALQYNSAESSFVYRYQSVSSAEIHVRVVDSPTVTQAGGLSSFLPENQNTLSEWSAFWVELWVSTNNISNAGIQSVDLALSYRKNWSSADWTSVTQIEFGESFTENQFSSIDDKSGVINGLHAETTSSNVGIEDYVLFARIKFESLESDQIDLDLSGKSIGPYNLTFDLGDPQVRLIDDSLVSTMPGAVPHTQIYANPYDLNDDDVINFKDLILFVSVYNSTPSTSDSDYAWFADYNQDDRVNFRDLILFVANYGSSKQNQQSISYPQNFPEAWNHLLVADTQDPAPQTVTPVAQSVVDAAYSSVVDQVSSSLSLEQNQILEQTEILVVDLEGDTLGRAAGGTIYIDVNAAGYGWYVDMSPAANSDFLYEDDLTLIALPDSDADGRFDLQTVIFHELGHLLGYEHSETGWMQETLSPGIRLMPDWELNFEFDEDISAEDTDEFFLEIQEGAELTPF